MLVSVISEPMCVCAIPANLNLFAVFLLISKCIHILALSQLYSVHMFFIFVNFSVYGFVLYLLDNCDSAVVQNSLNYVLSN